MIVVRNGGQAERGVPHAFKRGVVGEHVIAQHFLLARIDAAIIERLSDRRRLRAARDPDVDRLRVDVLGALHVGGKVWVRDWEADCVRDFTASFLEGAVKRLLGIVARA